MTLSVVLAVLLVAAGGETWLQIREHTGSWAWWRPPPRITLFNRRYNREGPVRTEAQAEALTPGPLKQVGTERPGGWSIWSWPPDPQGAVPTVAFLREHPNVYALYALSGGP